MRSIKTLSVREAAQRLRCTRKFVFDLLYENRLTGARKVGREWQIPAEAVQARIEARETRNG